MSREDALRMSDALVEAGQTHHISVGVHDGYMPRERYSVSVRPALTLAPLDIHGLQSLAAVNGFQLAFCGGSFEFVAGKDAANEH